MCFTCTQYHNNEGRSSHYSDVEKTNVKQDMKKKCSPKLETVLVWTQTGDLHKQGAVPIPLYDQQNSYDLHKTYVQCTKYESSVQYHTEDSI
jgi:hypothetical protein